jgi:coenzyme Q-binding protein COQ10
MPGASASTVIHATIEKVFSVITDYEKYAQFLSEVKKVKVGPKKDGQCDVEYEASLMKTIHYTLHMKEEAPSKVSWTFVKGDFMKDNKGSWLLEAAGEGQVKATYTIEVGLSPLVPQSIVNALVGGSLPKMLEAFKKRAEAK